VQLGRIDPLQPDPLAGDDDGVAEFLVSIINIMQL
jgi:hypothetical protein